VNQKAVLTIVHEKAGTKQLHRVIGQGKRILISEQME
jgi:hypothetical protein